MEAGFNTSYDPRMLTHSFAFSRFWIYYECIPMKTYFIISAFTIFALGLYITSILTTTDQVGSERILAYSSSCPAACDKNSDGSFTVDDAQTFAACIFSGCAADVNGDGTADAGDLSYCTANCQDIMVIPTTAPTAVPSPTQTPSPTIYIQPTTIPTNSTQSNTNNNSSNSSSTAPTAIPPTLAVPTLGKSSNNSTLPTPVKLRKDAITGDYSKYCDTNSDGSFTTVDIDAINKCIFDGYGYCATTDINADTKVDAVDISAAVLCSNNGQAMPNCKGVDFNNDERITQDEVNKISNCIFSKCYLIDPNYDGKTDAGDVSKCNLLSQRPTPQPSFSCSLCTGMNYCSNASLAALQDCIFSPNKPGCQQIDFAGRNI